MSRVLPSLVALSLIVGACGGDESGSCREVREAEDPQSSRHLLSADGYRYLTDPPTSGPHIAGPVPAGVVTEPVAPPVQVRILESGGALVQYEPATLGPADELPAPVVATAWTWKLTCATVDIDRIERFVAERPSSAPGAD